MSQPSSPSPSASPTRVLRPRLKSQPRQQISKKRKGDGDDGIPKVYPSKVVPISKSTRTGLKSTQIDKEDSAFDGPQDLTSATPKKPPSYKSVVQLLTTPLREEERMVRSRNGESMMKTYLVYQCPNQYCKEKNREIWFQKSVGFINPFNHLRSCIANGDSSHLYMVYEQNRESKRLHISGTFFQPSVDRLTAKELAVNDFIRLVVLKSLPITIVEDKEFRSFHRFNESISRKLLKEVIFKLVEIVDEKLRVELKLCGKGSILHDGWTCAGVHYIGLFACYNTGAVKTEKPKPLNEDVQLSLLSVSPMARTELTEEDEIDTKTDLAVYDETAVNFSSQTHAEHIRNVFRYYGLNVEDWAVCQTADNCSVNRKVAELLGIPHVSCKNHMLNLEVNKMVKQTRDLEQTLNTIHDTMAQCKKKLKNAALLRNLVNLVPVLHNKTRWSGKLYMMERFLKIRDELIAVAEDENSDLQMNRTVPFRNKVSRYCEYMQQINLSTKYMQTRKLTLAQCRESLNMLMQDVDEGRNDRNSVMYRCPLGKDYISEDAELLRDPAFESGVCKIQNRTTELMTDEEKEACEKLLVNDDGNTSGSDQEGEVEYEE